MGVTDLQLLAAPPGPQMNGMGNGLTSTNRRGNDSISNRWYFVLTLHLTGRSTEEICELTGYGPARVYAILKDERVLKLRQHMLSAYDDEFQALYCKVVDTIRDGLESEDIKVRMEAAEKWMKAHGKYQVSGKGVNITAEDVVINLLQQFGEP